MTDRRNANRHRSPNPLLIAATGIAVLAAGPLALAEPTPIHEAEPAPIREAPPELTSCVALAEANPQAGLERAAAWKARRGGAMAALCEAMALFHNGDFAAAGTALEALVEPLGAQAPAAAASVLARAGWAWLRAGDAERADRLYTRALDRQPGDVDLHIDRAFARAEAERFWDAIGDLDRAIALAPGRADALVFRATAYRALAQDRRALDDIARALDLAPRHPGALLLRGNIRAMAGDTAGARADWTAAMAGGSDTGAGRAAKLNLDRLDAALADAP